MSLTNEKSQSPRFSDWDAPPLRGGPSLIKGGTTVSPRSEIVQKVMKY